MLPGGSQEVWLSDLPPHTKLLGVKWVLKIKKIDGEYEMHKARLVAKGTYKTQDFIILLASRRTYPRCLNE